MRTAFTLLSILFISNYGYSQDFICTIDELDKDQSIEICESFKSNQLYSFSNNSDAIIAVEKIIQVAGLPMNFIVKECSGVPNASAFTYEGVRYIMYNKSFMTKLNSSKSEIESKTVIAHEIGHHLSGHTTGSNHLRNYCSQNSANYDDEKCLTALKINRKHELEADRFAGFAMQKLNYNLTQIQSAYKQFANNNDDTYSTHPKLDSRLEAIKNGFDLAKSQTKNESNKTKEKLEEIKGEKIEFEIPKLDRIERYALIKDLNLQEYITWNPMRIVNKQSNISFAKGSSSMEHYFPNVVEKIKKFTGKSGRQWWIQSIYEFRFNRYR